MTFDYQAHNQRMVDRFIWLESLDPDYAKATLEAYRRHPDSPNPNILADVKAEKAKRLQGSNACANATVKPETLPVPSTSRLESGR